MHRVAFKLAVCGLLWLGCACSDTDDSGAGTTDPDPEPEPEQEGQDCNGACEETQVCVSGACVERASPEGGGPCLQDDDCPENQGCLDLGNNVRACQVLCDPQEDDNGCESGCTEVNGRGFCQCSVIEPSCGDVFCINGLEPDTLFCGPCRSSGDIIRTSASDQCCGPNDNSTCTELYRNSGLTEIANLAACLIPEGAQTGVCGVNGEFGVNFECLTGRDCDQGQACVAEFGDPCTEAGLDGSKRCLLCRDI